MPPARRRVEVRACLYPLVSQIVLLLEGHMDGGAVANLPGLARLLGCPTGEAAERAVRFTSTYLRHSKLT